MFLTASGRVPGYRGASRILQGGHLIARAEHGLDRRETVRRPSGTRVKGTGMRAGDVSGGGVFGVFRRCQRARVTATNPTMLHGRPVNGYVAAIADDVREDLHEAMAPCTPQAYMAAYVAMVGPKVAGIALLS